MLRRAVHAFLDRQEWADTVGDLLVKIVLAVLRPVPPLKDLLHGTWLGHALHPMLTDVAVGALTAGLVLDLLGQAEGAKWTALVGFAAMLGSAVTGLADLTGTDGRQRRYAAVHGLVMSLSAVLYLFSMLVRTGVIGGTHAQATGLAIGGYVLLAAGAYLGGEVVFSLGAMVDRHAWRSGGKKWAAVEPAELPEGALTKAKAGAQQLVMVRRGDTYFALHDSCAHAGCSLAEMGRLVGDRLECTCHGSRFELRTGHVVRGPATFDQPVYEVRREGGRLEARRKGP